MSDRHRLLLAMLRQNLGAFTERTFRALHPGVDYVHNWHLDHIAWQLRRVERGEVKRLIINVPPRSLKSIQVSVAFPSWLLGRDPTKRIMSVSYSGDFALELARFTRSVMVSDWYREAFPECVLTAKRDMELVTSRGGRRFAAGVGGAVLGRGADIILVDDPLKAIDAISEAERRRVNDFYDNTLVSRLNDRRTGAIVIIMQRLHQDDLVGHVLPKDDWEVVSLPAIAVETKTYRTGDRPQDVYCRPAGQVLNLGRDTHEDFEKVRRSQGSLVFAPQYQQTPVPPEGNIVRREWIRRYETRPESFDLLIASWDTASTIGESSDYSVGMVWGAKGLDYYLLDIVRGRYQFPELRQRIVMLARQWSVNATVIEETELGRAVVQDLRRTHELRPILWPARIDKQSRMEAQSARFEAGQVHAPQDAPWLADWLSELMAFPNGRNDDQVDATSQALAYLTRRTTAAYAERQPRPQAVKRPLRVIRPPGYK